MLPPRSPTGTGVDRLQVRLQSLVMEVVQRILEHRVLEGFLLQRETAIIMTVTERVVAVLVQERQLLTECYKRIAMSEFTLGDRVFAEISNIFDLEWANSPYKGKKRILAREIADVIMWRLEGNDNISTVLLQGSTKPGFRG